MRSSGSPVYTFCIGIGASYSLRYFFYSIFWEFSSQVCYFLDRFLGVGYSAFSFDYCVYDLYLLYSIYTPVLVLTNFNFFTAYSSHLLISSCKVDASPKAKEIKEINFKSDFVSLLVASQPLQMGQDFLSFLRICFSIQSLQNRWEHFKQVGVLNICLQKEQLRTQKSFLYFYRSNYRHDILRTGNNYNMRIGYKFSRLSESSAIGLYYGLLLFS